MPPAPPEPRAGRVITYAQKRYNDDGSEVSLLPLLTQGTGITHVIVAAIHLNEGPGNIHLNDHPPEHPRYARLWGEVNWLQGAGVPVLGMLGGAARGSFERLAGDDASFEAYYLPLKSLITKFHLSGIDLDIEEPVPLSCPIRLIRRLRADFGPSFLITLAPVATALLPSLPHLSGFSYFELHQCCGNDVAWYNTQFYCGWGDARTTAHYDTIIAAGWPPEKVVLGLVTNPENGAGFVEHEELRDVIRVLRARYPRFGGVMGWEYFNSLPGDKAEPWRWAKSVKEHLIAEIPVGLVEGGRGVERLGTGLGGAQLPFTPPGAWQTTQESPFGNEKVEQLQTLGFTRPQAIAALNVTQGNVEYAAGLLFQE
ncbi:MAG: Cyclin-dependent kinase catalytic subunit [Bogoriella megaspora]|nr:MAG: Cyclin-dependent kinase catalytic subunit [Bogoriella megaspora]